MLALKVYELTAVLVFSRIVMWIKLRRRNNFGKYTKNKILEGALGRNINHL
jgi:hypothetical protein